jgi:hypothetical protein
LHCQRESVRAGLRTNAKTVAVIPNQFIADFVIYRAALGYGVDGQAGFGGKFAGAFRGGGGVAVNAPNRFSNANFDNCRSIVLVMVAVLGGNLVFFSRLLGTNAVTLGSRRAAFLWVNPPAPAKRIFDRQTPPLKTTNYQLPTALHS